MPGAGASGSCFRCGLLSNSVTPRGWGGGPQGLGMGSSASANRWIVFGKMLSDGRLIGVPSTRHHNNTYEAPERRKNRFHNIWFAILVNQNI